MSKMYMKGFKIFIVFVLGLLMGSIFFSSNKKDHYSKKEMAQSAESLIYTCSMHPQIKRNEPGKCPICSMDLVLLNSRKKNDSGTLKLSPNAVKLAEIESVKVVRKEVHKVIRVVGKVGFDETLQKTITAWIPGRLDRLFVDYTGVQVKKKDHLVSLYSPELLAAQEELLQTFEAFQAAEGATKKSLHTTLNSIKEKLRLWGLEEQQIQRVIETKKASDQMTIYSPLGGVVIHKMIKEGMYVKAGTPLYMIADLTHLWLKLDVYEADLPWVHYGQLVEFETEAWPGEVFTGKIIFIAPVVDKKTRTIKVRVKIPNPENKLKPEMFVRAKINASLQFSGKAMPPGLEGKWISPMHPEIIKDEKGHCDICGMDLVRAETLYSANLKSKKSPMVIPASAALITGKRVLVYLDLGEGQYVGKEIKLGPRAGDYYVVESGLKVGDKVVVRGNFKLDSAVQIQAGPSMMSPAGIENQHAGSDKHETPRQVKKDERETDNKKGSHRHGSHKH